MNASNTIPVFVYGTLKRGHYNYSRFLSHSAPYPASFAGEATTRHEYPLEQGNGFPFLHDRQGVGHRVKGDLFRVSGACLRMLDRLEGHPRFYRRREIEVVLDETGERRKAWVYFIQGATPPEDENCISEWQP